MFKFAAGVIVGMGISVATLVWMQVLFPLGYEVERTHQPVDIQHAIIFGGLAYPGLTINEGGL